ncbi:MAG: thioredoxin [Anaerovoracaceae bacterium]
MGGSDLLIQVSDDSFEAEVVRSDKPTLVDFWAPWCGPCRAVGPIIEEIAREYEGKLKVAKVNVDDNPNTAASHGIRSIPTIMLFKDGKLQDTLVGLVPKDRLEAFVKKVL